jgi:hypothetical protein
MLTCDDVCWRMLTYADVCVGDGGTDGGSCRRVLGVGVGRYASGLLLHCRVS